VARKNNFDTATVIQEDQMMVKIQKRAGLVFALGSAVQNAATAMSLKNCIPMAENHQVFAEHACSRLGW
jgi:hypothetical protein